jgi:hypothetical protein
MKRAKTFGFFGCVMLAALVFQATANAQGTTVSIKIKGLKGEDLTTSTLNALRTGNQALSADDYRNRLQVAVTPQGSGVNSSATFDPNTASLTIVFSTTDPNNLRANVTVAAPGLLEPVNLDGLAVVNQSIQVIMPLTSFRPCSCTGCWCRRRCRG